ncbi:MAG: hypothetical protein MI748_01685 [Opitutales bacterium]|nr:hypothetical protein [Opitutales bacterium]
MSPLKNALLLICLLFFTVAAQADENDLWQRVLKNCRESGYRFPSEIAYNEDIIDGTGAVVGHLKLRCQMEVSVGTPKLVNFEVIEGKKLLNDDKIEWVGLLLEHTGIDTPFFIGSGEVDEYYVRDESLSVRGIECSAIDFSRKVEEGKVSGTVWVNASTEFPLRIESRFTSDHPINIHGEDLVHFNRVVDFEGTGSKWNAIEATESGWFTRKHLFSNKLVVHEVKLIFGEHQKME